MSDENSDVEISADDIVKGINTINSNVVKINHTIAKSTLKLEQHVADISIMTENILANMNEKLNKLLLKQSVIEHQPYMSDNLKNNNDVSTVSNSNEVIIKREQTQINPLETRKEFTEKKEEKLREDFPALKEPTWSGVDKNVSLGSLLAKNKEEQSQ